MMNSNETVGVKGTAAAAAGASGGDGIVGLSRTSALNNRYFDDKAKSRSLDNLLEGPPDIQVCVLCAFHIPFSFFIVKGLAVG